MAARARACSRRGGEEAPRLPRAHLPEGRVGSGSLELWASQAERAWSALAAVGSNSGLPGALAAREGDLAMPFAHAAGSSGASVGLRCDFRATRDPRAQDLEAESRVTGSGLEGAPGARCGRRLREFPSERG